MHLAPYRAVLRIPGMRLFMLVALVARIPTTATGTALTLSVVLDRHRGYGAAGLVSAAFTVGLALGSPLLGRAVDRRGPRPVLATGRDYSPTHRWDRFWSEADGGGPFRWDARGAGRRRRAPGPAVRPYLPGVSGLR